MKRQWLVLALLSGLVLSAVSGTRAVSEPVDEARIARLISELASTKFSERRQASLQLDAIGEPALTALRKATSHADMETCHRAKELVASIEKRLDTAAVLAPTRVRLVCKDMAVTDAIAELAKKAKLEILIDQASRPKLAQRKITLDTGDVTFWEALDTLCQKAGLIETSLPHTNIGMDTYIVTPQGIMPPQQMKPLILPARPAIELVPQKPKGIKAQPQKPQPQKAKQAEPQKPKDAQAQPQKPKPEKANDVKAQPQKMLPAQAAKRAFIRRLVIPPLVRQAQIQLALIDFDVATGQSQDSGRIVLGDGKPEVVPTYYAGAFRIRARTSAGRDSHSATVTFEVTAEPRHLGWNLVGTPRLERARDSRGQLVMLLPEQPTNLVDVKQWGGNIRIAGQMQAIYLANQGPSTPLKRTVQIQIALGEKPDKLLEEIMGRITVEAKTVTQDLIVVDGILKAAGTTIKGVRGGSIEVIEVIKDKNGNHQVRFRLGKGQDGQGNVGLVNARAFFLSCQPPSGAPADQGNVRLVDSRGAAFPMVGRSLLNNNGDEVQTLTFQAQKGREPAKLVFSAPLTVNVDVPFRFKGLKLP